MWFIRIVIFHGGDVEQNTFLQKSKKYCRSLRINLLCASVIAFLPYSDFLGFKNPPWGKSSRSTGCASPRGTVGWWCPGCAPQWQLTEPRTLSSGWCTVWFPPPPRASWEEQLSLITSTTYHFCWRSNKYPRGYSIRRAWCWSVAGRSQPNLNTTKHTAQNNKTS